MLQQAIFQEILNRLSSNPLGSTRYQSALVWAQRRGIKVSIKSQFALVQPFGAATRAFRWVSNNVTVN